MKKKEIEDIKNKVRREGRQQKSWYLEDRGFRTKEYKSREKEIFEKILNFP